VSALFILVYSVLAFYSSALTIRLLLVALYADFRTEDSSCKVTSISINKKNLLGCFSCVTCVETSYPNLNRDMCKLEPSQKEEKQSPVGCILESLQKT